MTIPKRGLDALPSTGLAASRVSNKFGRIVLAFILRDMRTRFGRSYVSYLLSIGWPISHLLVMFGGYVVTHKLAPIGDDPSMFAFTGLVPYILFLYPARFLAFAVIQNKPLLNFPIVMPIQLILARVILEALSAVVVFFIFYGIIGLFGTTSELPNMYLASSAIAATLYLSIGFGVLGVVLCAYQPFVGVMSIVIIALIMYLLSGAIVPITFVSGDATDVLVYNPLYNVVGVLRSAYYDSYDQSSYSIYYVFLIGSVFLGLGLLGERLVRARLVQ